MAAKKNNKKKPDIPEEPSVISSDSYWVPDREGEGKFTEKMSRFLSFARRVDNADEAREFIKGKQNEFHDSRHVCWAYILGSRGEEYQLNDNGEPSGTAGRPILGQIRSFGLTCCVVAVARYFGGIKLGTSGLIAAYKEAARLALEDCGRREMVRTSILTLEFPYEDTGAVMKLIKNLGLEVTDRAIDNISRLCVRVKVSEMEEMAGRIAKICKVTE